MPIYNISQQCTLNAFISRQDISSHLSGTSPNEIDHDLFKSPTRYITAPFVAPQILGPFLEPPPPASVPVQPVHESVVPQTLLEHVRETFCANFVGSIKATTFCLKFVEFKFPESAVSTLLTKMGLVSEKNRNLMVDIRRMNESLDEFVESLVQMKEIVDFIVAVINRLKKKPKVWAILRDPSSPDNYIQTPLPKEVLQLVRRCLTTMGFSEGNKDVMKVPSNLASLSAPDLLEKIWTDVSKYDWESAPLLSKKRFREDSPHSGKSIQKCNKRLALKFMTKFMQNLLAIGFDSQISLYMFISTAFLDLDPELLKEVMFFCSNPDHMYVLQKYLMEMLHLKVEYIDDDIFISFDNVEVFRGFNMMSIVSDFDCFYLEAIMMRQSACQKLHEEFLQQELRKKQKRQRIKSFITALRVLWKTNDINAFFQELIAVCPEFNSSGINWNLLEVVVGEFVRSIYNATTRTYHNGEPCDDPLQVFLEYATIHGVFSPIAPDSENIRICKYSETSCPFGSTCSGAHQDFESQGWKKGRGWGICCKEYAERRTCRNPHCSYAHFTGYEFYRAFINGGKDSNEMRRKLLAQAYIAKRLKPTID
jgi:hypothetical protein